MTTDFNKELRRHTQDIIDKAFRKYKTKNFSELDAKINFKIEIFGRKKHNERF